MVDSLTGQGEFDPLNPDSVETLYHEIEAAKGLFMAENRDDFETVYDRLSGDGRGSTPFSRVHYMMESPLPTDIRFATKDGVDTVIDFFYDRANTKGDPNYLLADLLELHLYIEDAAHDLGKFDADPPWNTTAEPLSRSGDLNPSVEDSPYAVYGRVREQISNLYSLV